MIKTRNLSRLLTLLEKCIKMTNLGMKLSLYFLQKIVRFVKLASIYVYKMLNSLEMRRLLLCKVGLSSVCMDVVYV